MNKKRITLTLAICITTILTLVAISFEGNVSDVSNSTLVAKNISKELKTSIQKSFENAPIHNKYVKVKYILSKNNNGLYDLYIQNTQLVDGLIALSYTPQLEQDIKAKEGLADQLELCIDAVKYLNQAFFEAKKTGQNQDAIDFMRTLDFYISQDFYKIQFVKSVSTIINTNNLTTTILIKVKKELSEKEIENIKQNVHKSIEKISI